MFWLEQGARGQKTAVRSLRVATISNPPPRFLLKSRREVGKPAPPFGSNMPGRGDGQIARHLADLVAELSAVRI